MSITASPNVVMLTAEEAVEKFGIVAPPSMTVDEFFALLVHEYGLRFGYCEGETLHYQAAFVEKALADYRTGNRFNWDDFGQIQARQASATLPKTVAGTADLPLDDVPLEKARRLKGEVLITLLIHNGNSIQYPGGGLYDELASELRTTRSAITQLVQRLRGRGVLVPSRTGRGVPATELALTESYIGSADYQILAKVLADVVSDMEGAA